MSCGMIVSVIYILLKQEKFRYENENYFWQWHGGNMDWKFCIFQTMLSFNIANIQIVQVLQNFQVY